MQTREQKIKQLQALIEKWNHEYYVLAQPTVSDVEYDRVFNELQKLSPSTISVGSDLSNRPSPLGEFPHPTPMLSLDKVYTLEEMQKWLDKIPSEHFAIEPKIDGVSVSLQYSNGKLLRALTRGDGSKGTDITNNIKTIKEVPQAISSADTLYVRGEVYIEKQSFIQFKDLENIPYANPRNLAAGVLRRLDAREVEKAPLQIFLYQVQKTPEDFQTHQEALNFLKKEGFPLPPFIHFFSKTDDISHYIKEIENKRKDLPFEIDGLVIKVDSTEKQQQLGETNHHPRWAMAFKFESPTGISEVTDIVVQVGRTGKITPLAHIKPVKINGSTIKKATLHNKEYIQALEVGIGDIVSVSKRGEIIPAIDEVIEKRSPVWVFPDICPSCSSVLVEQGAHLFCTNALCSDKVKMGLLYFAQQLEMDGFGKSVINLLYQQFEVRQPQDFWKIDFEKLEQQEGFGKKKVQNLKIALQDVITKTSFKKLLIALGISEVSESAVQMLISSGYFSIDALLTAKMDDLLAIKGIGGKTAEKIVEIFSEKTTTTQNIYALGRLGFSLIAEQEAQEPKDSLPLNGTVWVLTGSFENYKPREKAQDIIQTLGGKVIKTLTKQTTHLLYGKDSGAKLAKTAKNPNIELITEEKFQAEIEPLLKNTSDNDSLFDS